MEDEKSLDPEVLDKIQSFSGPVEAVATIGEGKALQQVKTSYVTAVKVQEKRSISKITANVLEEAKLAGKSFYYGWKVKNKATGRDSTVEGPAIDLAMCIARNYGNCVIELEEEETLTHYKFKPFFIDLETGFTSTRLFRQRKNQTIGMNDADRQEDIVYQIGQSKAIRNVVVRSMPNWLIDLAIETAKEAELKGINPQNIAIARVKMVNFFQNYGIAPEQIEASIGRKVDQWTPQDIVALRGSATALKEGRISPNELFPPVDKKEEGPKEKKEAKKKDPEPKKEEPPSTLDPDAELIVTRILKVEDKVGRGPYIITAQGNERFITFSDSFASIAGTAVSTGEQAEITYVKTKYGNEIKNIEIEVKGT